MNEQSICNWLLGMDEQSICIWPLGMAFGSLFMDCFCLDDIVLFTIFLINNKLYF